MAVPAALKAAIELGVFEILAKARGAGKSLTAKEIVSQVLPPDSGLSVINYAYLERILRLLASENVVRESAVTVPSGNSNSSTERCLYALQPLGTYFVRSDEDAASLAPLLVHLYDRVFLELSNHLSATRLYMQAVLRAYHGFQEVKCLVDVGGGRGSSFALITAKYPNIQGINYDLPHVAAASPAYPGVEHVGGEMFESVPSGDAIFMKVLIDSPSASCIAFGLQILSLLLLLSSSSSLHPSPV
ncbi:unnamed protein product [Sphagnum jensenii]|uniref:O-methyltransferase domain-containing protein n=1 Tax=Sphagnum jensenii TaxID=128206 RepID=A0ABP0X0P5_9BRYO